MNLKSLKRSRLLCANVHTAWMKFLKQKENCLDFLNNSCSSIITCTFHCSFGPEIKMDSSWASCPRMKQMKARTISWKLNQTKRTVKPDKRPPEYYYFQFSQKQEEFQHLLHEKAVMPDKRKVVREQNYTTSVHLGCC